MMMPKVLKMEKKSSTITTANLLFKITGIKKKFATLQEITITNILVHKFRSRNHPK